MRWFERQLDRIRGVSTQCIIDARDAYGAPYIFHALASSSDSTLWIELEDDDGAIRIGNRLSTALLRATGATFFGMGMPYQYGLNYLLRLTDQLGPITLLVSKAHCSSDFTNAALRCAAASGGRFRVVVSGKSNSSSWHEIVASYSECVVAESELHVSEQEAIEMFTANDDEAALIEDVHRLAGGAYEGLLAAMSGVIGGRPPIRPSPDGVPVTDETSSSESGILERLMAADRWQEAFEHAVRTNDDLALSLLNEAADSYFSNGEVPRFLQFMRRLTQREPHNATVMYWDFQAHVSMGQLQDIEDRAERFFRCHEAPDLQAAFASAVRPPNALALAEAAVDISASPETLASLGFLRVMHGDVERGILCLKESFEGYKAARRYHKAIQLSNSIGSAYVSVGEYRRGLYWAQWSLDELRRRGIREELLRLSSVNLSAFTHLLIGEVDAGEEALRQVAFDMTGPLPPTLEGLISTVGDYEIVLGRPESGLHYYQYLVKQLGSQLPGFSIHNYVRGLIHAGRLDDAVAAVEVAEDLLNPHDAIERVHIKAARVLADVARGTYDGSEFEALIVDPVVNADAVLRIELVICHCVALVRGNHLPEAQRLLTLYRHDLRDLGRSAWVLYSPPGSDIDSLRELLGLEERSRVRLNMMGARAIRRGGHDQPLSLRFAELLVLLALHRDGLSGEALLYEMYGDLGQPSTLKATISRARKFIAIESVPYRIEQAFDGDFIELEDLLKTGRLREALELYKGPLLPQSEAPGVRRARERIDEAVRQAVLHAGEWDLVLRLARKFVDDLELWEEAGRLAPKNDPAYPLVRAQIRRIRGEWGL